MSLLTIKNLKLALKDPKKIYSYLKKYFYFQDSFVQEFLSGRSDFLRYKKEIEESGLVSNLLEKKRIFENQIKGKTYRGNSYNFGAISADSGIRIYSIIRKTKPQIAVETGVCNGISTAFILAAMEKNGLGKLYSIDFPEVAWKNYETGTFWAGKGGAVIPPDKMPGWIIPDHLRNRWELIIGKTTEKLLELLEKLGKIDFFMHDSEHSYECMSFEFNLAYSRLIAGGVLVSHDIEWNSAFDEFLKKINKSSLKIEDGVGMIIK